MPGFPHQKRQPYIMAGNLFYKSYLAVAGPQIRRPEEHISSGRFVFRMCVLCFGRYSATAHDGRAMISNISASPSICIDDTPSANGMLTNGSAVVDSAATVPSDCSCLICTGAAGRLISSV